MRFIMISISYNQLQLIKVNNYFSLFLLLFLVWHKKLFSYVYISYFWWGWHFGASSLLFPFLVEVLEKAYSLYFWKRNNIQYSFLLVQYAVTSPVINAYKIGCDFLPWQKLLQLLHQQPPYQLVLMVIYNATLKLAELVPRFFLLSSKVAFDIYLGKWQLWNHCWQCFLL